MGQPNVQDVATYALDLNEKTVKAFTVQKEACAEQMAALTIQKEAWGGLLEWASSFALVKPILGTLQKLHAGLTTGIDAKLKFHSGLIMKLDAELEEFSLVQEGIRGQIDQMREQQKQGESRILRSVLPSVGTLPGKIKGA